MDDSIVVRLWFLLYSVADSVVTVQVVFRVRTSEPLGPDAVESDHLSSEIR